MKTEYKITNIQFFSHEDEIQIGECEYETRRSYSSNIVINDSFIVQASGNENICDFSIPESVECFWNSEEAQNRAYEDIDKDKLLRELEASGFENNHGWLEDNANETM